MSKEYRGVAEYNVWMELKKGMQIRLSGWRLFLAGDISFLQALHKTLPTPLQPKLQRKSETVKLFGKPFVIPDGSIPVFIALVSEIVHANQYHIELIRDGASVVDAGANMGIFSIFVARKYPSATVYAFEPAPETFAALQENVKDYPNIRTFNCALGDATGTSSMVLTGWSIGNYIAKEGTVPITMRTLDDIGVKVDFLKIDTEGYEANILKGGAASIRKYRPAIVMSAYHKREDKKELPRLLNEISPYRCELRSDFDEDFVCSPGQ